MWTSTYLRCLLPVLLPAGFLMSTHATAAEDGQETSFPVAYVSIKQDDKIEVFPEQTIWKGGPTMLYTALTPDAKILLVTSPSTGSVYVFETDSGKQLAIIKTGKAAKGVKISPDGSEAYVSNEGEATISVVDMKTLKVVEEPESQSGWATDLMTKYPENVA